MDNHTDNRPKSRRILVYSKLFKFGSLLALSLSIVCAAPALAAETTMKETVQKTLEYNPTIKSFQEYRQAAQHDLRRARSDWFPRVDARAGFGAERWNDAQTRRGRPDYPHNAQTYYDRFTGSVVISQIIWDGMATWNRVTINEHRLDSAHERLYDNAEALSLDALLAHIEVFRQRRLVALAELNVRNHRRILGSQRERQSSGASTLADVTQTQSRLARTEATLAETRSALEVAIANYARLTGVEPHEIETPKSPEHAYASLEQALASAQTLNPKVKASRADILAADAQTELDKAPYHPTITLDASQEYNWRVHGADDYEWGNALMLNMTWNLFRGGYDWYNVKGDKARARQSRQLLNAQLDALTEETTATWSQYISAKEQARYFADAVEYSTRTRNMYLEQFNVGQRSLLDVLDGENEVYTSAIQFVTAQQNVLAAQYRLLALGGELLANFAIDKGGLVINTDKTSTFHNDPRNRPQ